MILQKEERELLENIMAKFEVAKKAQEEALVNTDICEDYFAGKQIIENAKSTDVVFNNITPIILSGIATLLLAPLTIELIPSSFRDREKVKLLERALRFFWEQRLDMEEKIEELLLTLKVYGTCFLSPQLTFTEVPELKVSVISPKYIFPDPTVIELEEAEFIIQIVPLPLVKVYRMFPGRGQLVEEEYLEVKQRVKRASFYQFISRATKVLSPVADSQQGSTFPQTILRIGYFRDDSKEEIRQYLFTVRLCPYCGEKFSLWAEDINNIKCLNCFNLIKAKYIVQDNKKRVEVKKKYPRGRRVIFTRNMILDDRPNPYLNFPYIAFRNMNIFKFWGLSDVEYLLSDQIALNRIFSVINRLLEFQGRPPLVKDRNADVKINTETGQIEPGCDILKNAGGGLEWLLTPGVSSSMFELMVNFMRQMDNKTGLRDRGRIKTATEVQILDEEEMRRQNSVLRHISSKLKGLVEQIVFILANYHTLSESIALDAKKDEYVFFRGVDYQDLLFDVRVKFATDQVPSRVIRNNQIIQMYQAGLITVEEAREMLDLPFYEEKFKEKEEMLNEQEGLVTNSYAH